MQQGSRQLCPKVLINSKIQFFRGLSQGSPMLPGCLCMLESRDSSTCHYGHVAWDDMLWELSCVSTPNLLGATRTWTHTDTHTYTHWHDNHRCSSNTGPSCSQLRSTSIEYQPNPIGLWAERIYCTPILSFQVLSKVFQEAAKDKWPSKGILGQQAPEGFFPPSKYHLLRVSQKVTQPQKSSALIAKTEISLSSILDFIDHFRSLKHHCS